MDNDKELEKETKEQIQQALEVFMACGFVSFRYVLDMHDTKFFSEILHPAEAAMLFPKMTANLYIKSLEGLNPNTGQWETI